jgi:hypothetical protein
MSCGDNVDRSTPQGSPRPGLAPPAFATVAPPQRPVEPFDRLVAAGRSPLELTAAAVGGYPPLPTYKTSVRNVSDRPVRRVVATVVYLDANGRALPGENHDVAFGSPLKPIDPGVTLETSFLSRVDNAPGVRLVVRTVIFLEKGAAGEASPQQWTNPRYGNDLAEAQGRR